MAAATPFVPPLILTNDTIPRAVRVRDAILTALLWFGWFYLLLAAVGAMWMPPFVQKLLPVSPPDNRWAILMSAMFCIGVAMTLIGLLLLRVLRERRRYGGIDRRLGRSAGDDAVIAAELGIDPTRLLAARAAREIVVEYDDGGRITGIRITD